MEWAKRAIRGGCLCAMVALASVKGDVDNGQWVFLDFNSNRSLPGKNEVKTAQALAGKNRLLVFRNPTELDAYLTAHPATRITTLVVSGHALGDHFSTDGHSSDVEDSFSVADLADLGRKHAGLAQVSGLYLWGCYSSVKSNVKLWASALPKVRFLAGFDELGPSGVVSAGTLEKVESGRRHLPDAAPSLANLSARMKPAFGKTSGTATLLLPDVHRARHVSNLHGASEFGLDPAKAAVCLATLEGLQKMILPARNLPEYTDRFRLGMGSEAKKQDVYFFAEKLPTGYNTKLRQIYARMQELTDCELSFYKVAALREFALGPDADEAEWAIEGRAMLGYLRQDVIVLIHAREYARNFAVCAKPLLDSLKRFLRRCANTVPGAVFSKAVTSAQRDSLLKACEAACDPAQPDLRETMRQALVQFSALPVGYEVGSNLSVFFKEVIDVSALDAPNVSWLNRIPNAADQRCLGLGKLVARGPALERRSCAPILEPEDPAILPSWVRWQGVAPYMIDNHVPDETH